MRPARLVEDWFGPGTGNFLVLERPILAAMPEPWQQRFVQVMQELDDATQAVQFPQAYEVKVRGGTCLGPAEGEAVNVDPEIQRERATEFIQQLMVQYGISLSELDVTGA